MSWFRRSSTPDLRIGDIYAIEEIRTADGTITDFATFMRDCAKLGHQKNYIISFKYKGQLLMFFGICYTSPLSREVHCHLQDSVRGKSYNRLDCMIFADPQESGVKLRVGSFIGDTVNDETLSNQPPLVQAWNLASSYQDSMYQAIVHLERPSFPHINNWAMLYHAIRQGPHPRKCRVEILQGDGKHFLGAGEIQIQFNSILNQDYLSAKLATKESPYPYSVTFNNFNNAIGVQIH